MDYRDEHPIGRRAHARRAVFSLNTFKTYTFEHLNQAKDNSVNLKRKLVTEPILENHKAVFNSWESNNFVDELDNQKWADIPWKLYEQLQTLQNSTSDESSSSSSSSVPLVTFKKSRDDDDDDILFKLEHDSTSNDGTETRPNSAKSEPLSSLDEEPESSVYQEDIEWETNNLSTKTTVPSTPEKQQRPIQLLKSPDEFSKKWRRAASLDSRVRTMLLLEKQRFQSKIFGSNYTTSDASAKKVDPENWNTLKKSDDQLEIDKTSEWFESCFSPNSTTTNELTKAKKVSLRKIKNSLKSKKEQCESCLSVLRFLLIRTGKELLDRLDEKPGDANHSLPSRENSYRKEKYCHKCKKLLSSADRSNDCDDDGEFRVKLPKLRSDAIFVPKTFPVPSGKQRKGPKKEVIRSEPKPERNDENGTKKCKYRRESDLEVLISGWQFVGEPSNKRIYCRHPDGIYRSAIRSCYNSVINDDVILTPGDYVLIAAQSMAQPFVAFVTDLYICPITGSKMAHVFWFYGQEVIKNQSTKLHEREIMASKHADDIDLNCIDDKCFVLTFNHYCRYIADQKHKDLQRWTRKFMRRHVKHFSTVKSAPDISPRSEEGSIDSDVTSSSSESSCESRSRKVPTYKQLEDTDPECIFWCNKVFDLQRKQILKYPH